MRSIPIWFASSTAARMPQSAGTLELPMRWKRSARSFGSSQPAVTMVFHSRSITSSRRYRNPLPLGACSHLWGLEVYMSQPISSRFKRIIPTTCAPSTAERIPFERANAQSSLAGRTTPRTRVLFFSHITTVTGVVLPAKELCALARSKGILSAVDGAHVVGMMRLNMHELGCDMYTSSPHKWLQAPKGSGFLYVRDEVIDRLWNTIVTAGWDEPKLRAERFQRIGSSNVPSLWGMRAAVQMANQIGMERIERRHRQTADFILKEIVRRGAESWTSPDAALRCAIASVNVAPIQITEIENWMWK